MEPKPMSFACGVGRTSDEDIYLLKADPFYLGRSWKFDPDKHPKDMFGCAYAVPLPDESSRAAGSQEDYSMWGCDEFYFGSKVSERSCEVKAGMGGEVSGGTAFWSASAKSSLELEVTNGQSQESLIIRLVGFQCVKSMSLNLAVLNTEDGQKYWNQKLIESPEYFMHENGNHFVSKLYIGGKYSIQCQMTFTSKESKSEFKSELEAKGQATWANLKATMNAHFNSKFKDTSEEVEIQVKALVLGGDQRLLTKPVTGNAKTFTKEMIEGLNQYRDSLDEFGAVLMLDLCAISPCVMQALPNLQVDDILCYERRATESLLKLVRVEEMEGSLNFLKMKVKQQANRLPRAVAESVQWKSKVGALDTEADRLIEELQKIQNALHIRLRMKMGEREVVLAPPTGPAPTTPTSRPASPEPKPGAGLINMEEEEFQRPFRKFEEQMPAIKNLVDGKPVAMTEANWPELRGGFTAACLSPVVGGGGDERAVGMPDSILIFNKGEEWQTVLDTSLQGWSLEIPGHMFDLASATVNTESGIAKASPQQKDLVHPENDKVLDFEKFPNCVSMVKYRGKMTWCSAKVRITYDGTWTKGKFQGRGTLKFTWQDEFKRGRPHHEVVAEVSGNFENGFLVGDASLQYAAQGQSVNIDISAYHGGCLVECTNDECFWKVVKNGVGVSTFHDQKKASKDRWDKDRKLSHIS